MTGRTSNIQQDAREAMRVDFSVLYAQNETSYDYIQILF